MLPSQVFLDHSRRGRSVPLVPTLDASGPSNGTLTARVRDVIRSWDRSPQHPVLECGHKKGSSESEKGVVVNIPRCRHCGVGMYLLDRVRKYGGEYGRFECKTTHCKQCGGGRCRETAGDYL